MTRRAIILGTGSALPPRRVTNDELAALVDTTHEWIVERTGIEARHIAGEGETTATLAADAARRALEAAGIEASQIGLIVLATATPDQTFQASATRVQTMLGIYPFAPAHVVALVRPRLPEWLPAVTVRNVRVGNATASQAARAMGAVSAVSDSANCVIRRAFHAATRRSNADRRFSGNTCETARKSGSLTVLVLPS